MFTRSQTTVAAIALLGLVACGQPDPRSVEAYMEDSILREAMLSRCNLDRLASRDDPDCIHARLAAQADAARQDGYEVESAAGLEALRRQCEADAAARREAEKAARQREIDVYEQRWIEQKPGDDAPLIDTDPEGRELMPGPDTERTSRPVEEAAPRTPPEADTTR